MKKQEDKDVLGMIQNKFGLVVKPSKDLADRPVEIISVSPSHDLALGGGIPQGSWVTIAGKPKTHKTFTTLHIARKAQSKGMTVYFGNVEGRLKKRDLTGINHSKFNIIESSEDKFLTATDYLNIFEMILKNEKRCLLIIDSVSMLADEKEIEGGIGTSTRGGGAKYMSQFCRNMAGVVPVKNHIVIGILQMMANTSGYGSPFQEKGGNSIVYQADVRLQVKQSEWNVVGNTTTGATVTWKLNASALGTPPNQEYQSVVKYGVGLDETSEIINLAENLGLISKAGAWYTLHNGEKAQGLERIREYYESHPKDLEDLYSKLKDLLK